ncbi:uncharacterized protein PgNI_00637 [Pyricularia grisea]|uniref:Carrier domain-containing protein n=1 Tax=Pyricularia grisea TaxID=148305 RepID=A0A6P8BLJ1_PYRGI|nr:uncharacterized protein PgNI_00637 [Pyricularia grisea]TLD17678.1 hypothetical protein PgNI_00637 [Pyricularia grisea]
MSAFIQPPLGSPKPLLPRIDTTNTRYEHESNPKTFNSANESVEARLVWAIGDTLGIDSSSIQMVDSFTDLGGCERTAARLSSTCRDLGLEVDTSDILNCFTLAELQTRIIPCSREASPQNIPTSGSLAIEPLKLRTNNLAPSQPRFSTSSVAPSTAVSEVHFDHESFICDEESVSRAVIIKPRAGFFDGKQVVFLSLAGLQVPGSPTSDIEVIPQTKMFLAGTKVAAIRHDLEAAAIATDLPDIWIVLRQLPVTEHGALDRRKLRTWLQNINQETYQQIMSLDTEETLQQPLTDSERALQKAVSNALQAPREEIGMNFSFAQLGGDEVTAMQVVARSKADGIFLSATELLQNSSLAQLAAMATSRGEMPRGWDVEPEGEQFDLSPMQQLYFLTTMGGDSRYRMGKDGSYRYNQSLLLRVKRNFGFDDISAAVQALVGHHTMLRSRFFQTAEGGWTQRTVAPSNNSYAMQFSTIGNNKELEIVIARSQAMIDIESGPVFAVDHIQTTDDYQMIYLVAHHLVVDLLSWRVILDDLNELLMSGSLLSHRSMPFQKWNELQKKEIEQTEITSPLPAGTPVGNYAYWGLQDVSNTYADASELGFSLSPELTTILQSTCNRVFRTDSADIYLAALLLSFSQTFHDRSVPVIWNQEHGRDVSDPAIDISDTVGWFTTLSPVGSVLAGTGNDFVDVLRRLKDVRRAMPRRGAQYFASKFFKFGGPDLFTEDWPFELIFNYAGSLERLEESNGVLEQIPFPGRTLASKTSNIGPNVGRIALFEVSAMVSQGSAHVKLVYNKRSRHQDLIAQWIQNFEHLLLEAIGRLRYHTQELTMADVPQLDVTYEGLRKLNYERTSLLNLTSVRDIEAVYPVTAVQQGILVKQAVDREASYLHAIYEFSSPTGRPINISQLCAAWQNVTTKHAALRTVFIDSVTETGVYDQVVLRRTSPSMLFIDVASGEDPSESLSNLPALPSRTSGQTQHRLAVCNTPTKTLVKLDISEALCDPQSLNVIFLDLRRAYTTNEPLPEPTGLTYPEYLKFLESARTSQSLDFWIGRLSGAEACLFPQLTQESSRRAFENYSFDLEVDGCSLVEFARSRNVTPDAVLRLGWGLVLRVFSGKDNVCFGYRATGREAASGGPSMRNAVGCFSNTVACNFDLSPYNALANVLAIVEEQYVASLRHQHVSIPEIHHVLGKRGDEQLFNSVVSFTNEPSELRSRHTGPADFELNSISHTETSCYDLAINVRFDSGRLVVDIGSMSLVGEREAPNIANTLSKALCTIMENPTSSIQGINLFTDRDYAQIVAWANERAPPEPRVAVVHELVETNARSNPHAMAVCAWDGQLTYGKLDDLSTRLAQRLAEAGVTTGVTVPLLLQKSFWSPVAMLAVLKAGGAFVPIDSGDLSLVQPIFENINSRVAIECENAGGVLRNLFDTVIVLNSELMTQLKLQAPRHVESLATEDDAACVFFTPSNSREVRGTAFTHGALSIALLTQGPAASINYASRVMQLSSYNVDIAISEVFATLVNGGCICIPTETERVFDFVGAVRRMEVNWSYMTPHLSRKLNLDQLPSLKTVCFRTRSLDEDTYAPWAGKKKVLFAYGSPDVCPLGISFLEVHGTHELNRIGTPLAGNFWLVNPEDHRNLMPIGSIGELVIEGPTLGCSFARGQMDRTHWNAAEFSDSAPGKTRYFKTGHSMRYMDGGALQLVSHKREDIEIDGSTIVLSEVEQNLRRCLGQGMDVVVEAIAFKSSKTPPVLTAFVELGSMFDGPEDLHRLSHVTRERTFKAKRVAETGMRNKVPHHMIPQIFVPVKDLPITSSLKVNRRKLQKAIHGLSREQLLQLSSVPNPHEVQTVGTNSLPLTQTEERMRRIWAHVLNIEDETSISAADGFIKAGGDDILAAKLVVCCRQEDIAISIADVLRDMPLTNLCRSVTAGDSRSNVQSFSSASSTSTRPTSTSRASSEDVTPTQNNLLAAAAAPAIVDPEKKARDDRLKGVLATKVGVDSKEIKDVAEASSMQSRYIESGMLRGRANINYFVFSFHGPVDHRKLEEACQTLITIHPILRTAFVPYKRRMYQVVLKTPPADFNRYLCPSWRLAAFAEKVIKKDQSTPIAFSAPMTKFILLDGGKQSTLLLRLSKAQYDDLSVALLVKDLKKLYDGAQNPPRRPTYAEFIRCAHIANKQGAEEYWKLLLDGANMTRVVAHSKPHQLTNHVKTIRQRIEVPSLAHLGISFETILKAGWAMTLAELSGTADVVFGEIVDGRQIRLSGGQSVAGVLGPTANTTAVRVRFPEGDGRLSPLDLLQYVHGQRIAGIPFENFGFLDLVERCTSWPYWMRFSTVVQHQYEETTVVPSESKIFHLGKGGEAGALCKFSIIESRAQDVPDMFIHSMARGGITANDNSNIELNITFCENRIPVSFAEETLRILMGNVAVLTSGSIMHVVIPSAAQYKSKRPQIPLPQMPSTTLTPSSPISHRFPASDMEAIQRVISKCWAAASLDPSSLGVPEEHRDHAAFYDLWGSLVPASQLASFLTREIPKLGLLGVGVDFGITMEEIADNPTMARQLDLIVRKTALALPKSAPLPSSPSHNRQLHSHHLSLDSPRKVSAPLSSPSRNIASKAVSKLTSKLLGSSADKEASRNSMKPPQHQDQQVPYSAPHFKSSFDTSARTPSPPREAPSVPATVAESPRLPYSTSHSTQDELERQLDRVLNEITAANENALNTGRSTRNASVDNGGVQMQRGGSTGTYSSGVDSLTDGSSATTHSTTSSDFENAVYASLPGYFGSSNNVTVQKAPVVSPASSSSRTPRTPRSTQYRQKFYGQNIAIKPLPHTIPEGGIDDIVSPLSPPQGHRRFFSAGGGHSRYHHQRGDSSLVTPITTHGPPPPYMEYTRRG